MSTFFATARVGISTILPLLTNLHEKKSFKSELLEISNKKRQETVAKNGKRNLGDAKKDKICLF